MNQRAGNMRALFFICVVLLLFSISSSAQQRISKYNLPYGALVVETQALVSQGHPDRALVLWMVRPTRNPREPGDLDYSCPDATRGSYYNGPTRVSLVNTRTGRVINTVKVIEEYMQDNNAESTDEFDVPYRIKAGLYYHFAGVAKGKEGQPKIMSLRDYNGDGKALEFALFDAMACMGLETTLIGYSQRQDKVIQYSVQLAVNGDNEKGTRVSHWCDYLFSEKPIGPGHWKYEIDCRGRGGSLDKYEVHYNSQTETFAGTYVWTAAP